MPDTTVYRENRPVGRTNADGQLLVPNLSAYEKNAISIDPTSLPVDAELPTTRQYVVPGAPRGAIAKFNVATVSRSALLILRDCRGAYLALGPRATLEQSGADFIVGYDGEVYVRDLAAENTIRAESPDGTSCLASFPFAPAPGEQVAIPLACE